MITIQEDKGIIYLSSDENSYAHGISFALKNLSFEQAWKLFYFKLRERVKEWVRNFVSLFHT